MTTLVLFALLTQQPPPMSDAERVVAAAAQRGVARLSDPEPVVAQPGPVAPAPQSGVAPPSDAEPVAVLQELPQQLQQLAPLVADAPLSDQGGRVRFGVSAQAGWRTFVSVFVIDVELHVGMQVTQWWSAYGLVKASYSTSGIVGNTGAPFIGAIGVMVEAMLNNHIYFAVGPLLGYGTFTGLDAERAIPRFIVEQNGASIKPGFDVRLGFATARSRPPRFARNGVSIGFELVGLYHHELAEISFGGFGGAPSRMAPSWIFTPMVSIGIDTR